MKLHLFRQVTVFSRREAQQRFLGLHSCCLLQEFYAFAVLLELGQFQGRVALLVSRFYVGFGLEQLAEAAVVALMRRPHQGREAGVVSRFQVGLGLEQLAQAAVVPLNCRDDQGRRSVVVSRFQVGLGRKQLAEAAVVAVLRRPHQGREAGIVDRLHVGLGREQLAQAAVVALSALGAQVRVRVKFAPPPRVEKPNRMFRGNNRVFKGRAAFATRTPLLVRK